MLKKTEQIAWLVLSLAFISCIALAIGVPTGVRWYLLNATRPMNVRLQPRSGAVTYQPPGNATALVAAKGTQLFNRSTIDQGENADALVIFYHPDQSETPIATIQLYGETDLTVGKARTPRFEVSQLPHHIQLRVGSASNMRVSVTGNGREAQLTVQTPRGTINLQEGTFKLIVHPSQTDLTVIDGQAHVPDPESKQNIVLIQSQQTQLTSAGLGEITIGERNIMRTLNGDFEEPLAPTWNIDTEKDREDETGGAVRQRVVGESRWVVFFTRVGQHWAQTGLTQEINQDIRGAKSLYVRARLRVDTHTLPVCGSMGTECPIMIRLRFSDQTTGSRPEWLQGFYAVEGDGTNEPFCPSCEWKATHIQVPMGVWYDYESPDLLPLLRAENIDPSALWSVEIYASGHTYGSAIDEIDILIGE
jgi:hypothetical protein